MVSNAFGVNLGLERFEEPIRAALSTYSEISDGQVQFDVDRAAILEPVPEDLYFAKSVSDVRYAAEIASQLVVLAFAPFDAGGPRHIPRAKITSKTETHLTIASALKEDSEEEPVMFAGNMALIGFHGMSLAEDTTLGQTIIPFLRSMQQGEPAKPTATYTAGQREMPESREQRFCNHQAAHNPWKQYIQVCGFMAVSPNHLNAQER